MKLNNIKVSFMFENNVVSPEKKQHLWKNGNHTFTIYRHTISDNTKINVKGAIFGSIPQTIKSTSDIFPKKFIPLFKILQCYKLH